MLWAAYAYIISRLQAGSDDEGGDDNGDDGLV